MTADKKIHFYIKHAIGSRMLFDVSGSRKPFVLETVPGGWRFVVEDVEPEIATLLEPSNRDLNLFYFVEQTGQPTQKYWFYDKDIPTVQYDAESKRWSIQVDSRMEYNNEKV
ncbi:hypothetical protein DVH26_25560 [Paenibacillus sp. H1-7]|uniref:hypothetical protein n=1 Tax=Paenibacillus sp. H1-7 TaxID=2282849 RepID=UPI001EF82CC6|nr:hypothetical protein [Paenibacillus sp. H1-7]ULL17522.1 hypothetical protein DVH26_25560 [Paenibacillus sp. H1-7]